MTQRTRRPTQDGVDAAPEVRVHDAVQQEVDGEVERLQRVGDRHGRVEFARSIRYVNDDLTQKVAQLGRRDEQHVHDDDNDERQRDAVRRLRVGRLSAPGPVVQTSHPDRPAQRVDQVQIAEREGNERHEDGDCEVRPKVGIPELRVPLQVAFVHVEQGAAFLTIDGNETSVPEPWQVADSARDKDEKPSGAGKGCSDYLCA